MNAFRTLVAELEHRSVWRVIGIYAAASWVALEVASTLTESVGLPEWFPAFALGLLVIGLPIVLATTLVQDAPPAAGRSSSVGAGADAGDGESAETAGEPYLDRAVHAAGGAAGS